MVFSRLTSYNLQHTDEEANTYHTAIVFQNITEWHSPLTEIVNFV